MAEIDVAADPPRGPQPFDGGVHVDGQADQQTNQVLCLNLVTNAIVTLPEPLEARPGCTFSPVRDRAPN